MKLHKRPRELNQQTSQPVRPPLTRDATHDGVNSIFRGKMPAGYVSVWDFGNGAQTKWSPVSVKEKKVL